MGKERRERRETIYARLPSRVLTHTQRLQASKQASKQATWVVIPGNNNSNTTVITDLET